MLEQIEELASKATAELNQIINLTQLEEWRVRYLGRKSMLVQALRSLSTLPLDERRAVGARVNEIKTAFESSAKEKKSALERSIATTRHGGLDVTLPGKQIPIGRLHPTTQTMNEICEIFNSMGFQIVEGPEVEWEYYNFDALNMPEGHPARDMFATLWVNKPDDDEKQAMLLRTHTSPVQIRTMEKLRPPIRIIAPGRVYRYEATDATHEWMFYQVEGLAIDKNITFADLKGTLFEFAYRLFGRNRKIRFRCDYFPFVEPGGELAIDCMICGGTGCRALATPVGWSYWVVVWFTLTF